MAAPNSVFRHLQWSCLSALSLSRFCPEHHNAVNLVPSNGFFYQGTVPCNQVVPNSPNVIPIYLEAGTTYRFDIGRLDLEFDFTIQLYVGGLSSNEIEAAAVRRPISERHGSVQESIQNPLWFEDRFATYEEQRYKDAPGADPLFTFQPETTSVYTLVVTRLTLTIRELTSIRFGLDRSLQQES